MGLFSKTCHIQIIEDIAKGMEAAGMNGAYLELGIAKGSCFNVVAPHFKRATAVDMNYESYERVCKITQKKGNAFFVGTTDDYFEKGNQGQVFDMVFIDACHKFENVKKDFLNSWNILNNNGLILLHDTFSPSKEYDVHCEDAFKINYYLDKTTDCGFNIKNIQFVTLPFYFGITIVRKLKKL